jgi:hypothetical protein
MNTFDIQQKNDSFTFRRWWLLVSLHWAENKRRYLLSLLAIAGLLAAIFTFEIAFIPIDFDFGSQFFIYYIGMFIAGCLYGNTVFSALGHRRKAIQYLTFPASSLEKLFCALFFGVILFFITYVLVFYIVDIPIVALNNMLLRRHGARPDTYVKVINVFSNLGGPIPNNDLRFLTMFFAIQSAYILGGLYFPRYSFITTSIFLVFFLFLLWLFIARITSAFLPYAWIGNEFFYWHSYTPTGNWRQAVVLPSVLESVIRFLLFYSWPFWLWLVIYHRLKEKEVRG